MNDIKNYIENNLLGEIKKLQDADFHYISFIVMTQAIEILGAFLDSKPIKAERQSRKRFRLAINKLFSTRYKRINQNDWMYMKLRNHLVHSFIPSSWIILTSRKDSEGRTHLSKDKGKIVFISEDYFNDFADACNRLLVMIESGDLKLKKLPDELLSQ